MNASKIVVPQSVASAIRHYTDLADTKSEAFTDILSMGFEGERSEVILRHFDGNHDELMEALICGYEVAQTPEDNLRKHFDEIMSGRDKTTEMSVAVLYSGKLDGIKETLDILGIKIDGVNA